jgi:hypothetical protein
MADPIVIPACLEPLTHERRWLPWRGERADNGRFTKVPYRGDQPSIHASSKDPTTWSSFETAMRAYVLVCCQIPLRSREDSPAVDSESLRGCPWRKKPNCWRAMTRTPFDFFLSISGYPLILT